MNQTKPAFGDINSLLDGAKVQSYFDFMLTLFFGTLHLKDKIWYKIWYKCPNV